MTDDLNRPLSSWKETAAMFFFVMPFFRPTIVNDWAELSSLKAIFALWLLAACVVALFRFVARNGRIGLFLSGLVLMLSVAFMSTLVHDGLIYGAMVDIAMILGVALFVTTLEGREVKAFLVALTCMLLVLVISELVLRSLMPQGVYIYEGGPRWILENGSLQSRWCFILVFAAAALDYMRRGKYGILFYTSTVASMLLAFQLASATSIVALSMEVAIILFAGSLKLQRMLTCRKVNVVFAVLLLAIVVFRIADYLPYDAIASILGKDMRYVSGATFTGRTYIWDSVIASISQFPFFGYGYQQYVAVDVQQFYGQGSYDSAHNLWLQIAFRSGLAGLAGFSLSYYSLCSKADSMGNGRSRPLFVGLLAAFLLTSIFENTLNSIFVFVMAMPVSDVFLETIEERGSLTSESDGVEV